MLAKDSYPRAYVFSSCNEKIKAIVVRGTTIIERDKGDEKYNMYQHSGIKGTPKWMELRIKE